ncbi:MAG: UvrB/UvrC motif-containing protein [bacterium]
MKNVCQACKENEINLRCVIVINGVSEEQFLCQECARKAGIEEQNKMTRKTAKEFVYSGKKKFPTCSACKRSYNQFLKTGMLGCPECYKTFETYLRDILKGIHSVSYHKGRGPGNERTMDIAQLKWKLSEAVREEDFELAARIRDEIQIFERGDN